MNHPPDPDLKRRLDAIEGKLDRLDEAIRGNGRPGIQLRLDRLEQSQRRRSRLAWLVIGAGSTLAVTNLWQLIFGA